MCHEKIMQCFPQWKTREINYEIKHLPFSESEFVQSPFRNTGFQSLINWIYMKHLPGSWREMMFGNISICMIFSGRFVMSLRGWTGGRAICAILGSLRHQCGWEFQTRSSLGLFSSWRKQIDGPKFSTLLPWLHWPCHLPGPVRLSFHWQHCWAWQLCMYGVLCTAAPWDFLNSVKMKEDQAVVFLTYSRLSELIQSQVIYGWEWTFIDRTFVLKMILRRAVSV